MTAKASSQQSPGADDASASRPAVDKYRALNEFWETEHAVKVLDKNEWGHAALAFMVFVLVIVVSYVR